MLDTLEKFRKEHMQTAKVCANHLCSIAVSTPKNGHLVSFHVSLYLFLLKDEKKRFEKISEKYYNSLEKYLGTGAKKKDVQAMHEVWLWLFLFTVNNPWRLQFDSALFKDQAAFQQTSFTYACQLQDVHAAKQYELVEPVSVCFCVF